MHISADFVTECEKFLFQLKALQKRMQKDGSRFFVAQAFPEIYEKNEMLKKGGMCFFVIDCTFRYPKLLSAILGEIFSIRFQPHQAVSQDW